MERQVTVADRIAFRQSNVISWKGHRSTSIARLTGIMTGMLLLSAGDLGALRAEFTTIINAPPDSIEDLRSIGSNTQLNLYNGAALDDFFTLGDAWESSHHIELNVRGGTIGYSFSTSSPWVTNHDIVVNLFDGVIADSFSASSGSVINIFGGTVGDYLGIGSGAVLNLHGGSTANIGTRSGSQFNIFGGEFRLDGVPFAGLENIGSSIRIDIPEGGVLSGTLADGRPLAISNGRWDYVANGTLTLHAAPVPVPVPRNFQAPGDSLPKGLRGAVAHGLRWRRRTQQLHRQFGQRSYDRRRNSGRAF